MGIKDFGPLKRQWNLAYYGLKTATIGQIE